jgi:hypothetical protein
MTLDDVTLMAYADGELSLLERKRVAQAIASDPALADGVAAFGNLRDRVRDAFAPIAQAPIPDRLGAMVSANVVPIGRRNPRHFWGIGLALAASLALGVGLGEQWSGGTAGPVIVHGGTRVAAGPLAHALDTQLASASGDVRILVSFRSASGYCRAFASAALDGIACRSGTQWRLPRTQSGSAATGSAYRQASSEHAQLMAAAQDMMIAAPLDAVAERHARANGWR